MELGERETTITYDLDQKLVRIFSAIRKDQAKLRKAGIQPKYGNGRDGFNYHVDLACFKWRIQKPTLPMAKRKLSPEHPFLRRSRARKGIHG